MNGRQKAALAVGAAALLAVFLFPYSRYAVETATSAGPGRAVPGAPAVEVRTINFVVTEGFRPVWRPADPFAVDRGDASPFGLGVRWGAVAGLALVVLSSTGLAVSALKSRARPQA